MKKGLGPKILALRAEGKSYNEIAKILGCAKSSVKYHCGNGDKEKAKNRVRKRRKSHPFIGKLAVFSERSGLKNPPIKSKSTPEQLIYFKLYQFYKRCGVNMSNIITLEKLIEKFTENPVCYLTGDKIDIYDTKSYHFDHIVPRSKGGDNSIDNLGICTKEANMAKSELSKDEFIKLCQKVVNYSNSEKVIS